MSTKEVPQKPVPVFVGKRPMASNRKTPFTDMPVLDWVVNAKVRRAAERVLDDRKSKYVEDGDVLYKVKVKY